VRSVKGGLDIKLYSHVSMLTSLSV